MKINEITEGVVHGGEDEIFDALVSELSHRIYDHHRRMFADSKGFSVPCREVYPSLLIAGLDAEIQRLRLTTRKLPNLSDNIREALSEMSDWLA